MRSVVFALLLASPAVSLRLFTHIGAQKLPLRHRSARMMGWADAQRRRREEQAKIYKQRAVEREAAAAAAAAANAQREEEAAAARAARDAKT